MLAFPVRNGVDPASVHATGMSWSGGLMLRHKCPVESSFTSFHQSVVCHKWGVFAPSLPSDDCCPEEVSGRK